MSKNITNTLVSRAKPADKPYEVRDAGLKGLLLRVQPSGVMTYYVEYARGKRVKIGPADALSPEKAREIAKGVLAEHYSGEDPIKNRKRVQSDNYLRFLKDVYSPYLAANLRGGIDNSDNVKETIACLERRFPEFHQLRLNEITPLLIEKWRQHRILDGVKATTINRQLNDLRACLNRAVQWDALPISPFNKVKPCKVDKNPKTRFLSPDEETSLRAALDVREAEIRARRESANQWREKRQLDQYADLSGCEFADYLKPAVLLSLNTGLRRGELFGLKWRDVDLEQRSLTIVGEGTKSGQTRHVPLNDEALAILKHWKQQPGVKSIYVFSGKEGKPFQNLRKSFTEVLRKAKITDFRWHDTRHTFASNVAMNSKDLNAVRELLGHSDFKMTQRYAHLSQDHKKAAVDTLTVRKALP